MQIPPPVVAHAAVAAQEKSAARMGYYSLLYYCPTATTSHILLPALVLHVHADGVLVRACLRWI
jgi:hypothetical protein